MRCFFCMALVPAGIALAASVACAAPNDFEVQDSNVDTIKIGTTFEKGARLVVPEKHTITLIDRTGAAIRTRECAGRYEGPIEQCPAPAASRPSREGPGATRGAVR